MFPEQDCGILHKCQADFAMQIHPLEERGNLLAKSFYPCLISVVIGATTEFHLGKKTCFVLQNWHYTLIWCQFQPDNELIITGLIGHIVVDWEIKLTLNN